MKNRWRQLREIGQATFPEHLRGVQLLGFLSVFLLIGLTGTGLWEFFFRESDPAWYEYVPGSEALIRQAPSRPGISELHGLLSDTAGVVTLVGVAWFAYRVIHRIPAAAIVAFCCVTFAAFGGGALSFNLIRQTGVPAEEASAGYAQLFTSDVDFLVTDRGQWGGTGMGTSDGVGSLTTFRIMLVSHILTIPVLVGFAGWSIRRGMDRRLSEILEPSTPSWLSGLHTSGGQADKTDSDG